MKTINTIKLTAKNKRVSKTLAVIFVVVLLLSMAITSVGAEEYNYFSVINSQLDRSYFYQSGSSFNSSWDASKKTAWRLSCDFSQTMNFYIVSTNIEENLIDQMEYLYQNNNSSEAAAFGTRWNTIWFEVQHLINATKEICSNGGTSSQAQNLCLQIQDAQTKLNTLAQEITESYHILTSSYNYTDVGGDLQKGGIVLLNSLWQGLGDMLKNIGTNSMNTNSLLGMSWTSNDIEGIANIISSVMKTFAYAIACILFGINVTTTSLQYEILTLRGGVKVFARVLLVKIWIDLAIPICMYVLNIINSLAVQIFKMFTITNGSPIFQISDLVKFDVDTDNGILEWIIKAAESIINFFANFICKMPALAIIVILVICIVSVLIKIIARAFELTALVAVSPLFFASLVGEETKQYFKKFISAFLSTAGYIVFMAIVYVVASKWIQQCTSATLVQNPGDLVLSVLNLLPKTLIIIACCRIMKKPPKVLTSLFDGG